MSECFVSGVSAKIVLYKYSSFPFLSFYMQLVACIVEHVISQLTIAVVSLHYNWVVVEKCLQPVKLTDVQLETADAVFWTLQWLSALTTTTQRTVCLLFGCCVELRRSTDVHECSDRVAQSSQGLYSHTLTHNHLMMTSDDDDRLSRYTVLWQWSG